jgi:hypothetical protein
MPAITQVFGIYLNEISSASGVINIFSPQQIASASPLA